MRLQIDACAVVCGRHGNVCENLAVEVSRRKAFERLEEYVETLVMEFVATARADNQRLFPELAVQTRLRNLYHRLAGFAALRVVLFARPDEVVLESVRRNHVRLLAEQIFALAGGNVAHRNERIVILRAHLLYRVFRDDIELAREVVGVEPSQTSVERQTYQRILRQPKSRGADGGLQSQNRTCDRCVFFRHQD